MMPTTENAQVLENFASFLKNGKLAHAYLFTGPQGVGKKQAALDVACLVNCETPADGRFCGICPSCRKIASGNHPDVTVISIEPDEQSIKIAKVREVIGRIQLKAYEARVKVYIILEVENLTPEGSNALLKTLEEPAANSLLILTSAVPQNILLTIRSRCQSIVFYPLPMKELAGRLSREEGCSIEEAHFLAHFSGGCLSRARQLKDDGVYERKNELIDTFRRGGDDAFLKNLLSDKQLTREALDILLSWARDALLLKSGAGQGHVINRDRVTELSAMACAVSLDGWQAVISDIVEAMRLWAENLNLKIPLMILRDRIQGLSTTR